MVLYYLLTKDENNVHRSYLCELRRVEDIILWVEVDRNKDVVPIKQISLGHDRKLYSVYINGKVAKVITYLDGDLHDGNAS